MKNKYANILFILICNFSFAQHTDEFQKIVAERNPSRTEIIDIKFRSGEQKELGKIAVYEFGEYEYTFNVGNWTKYYKSGQVLTEAQYDNYGNPIIWKLYDGKGNLLRESKAVSIDTNVKDFEQFLNDENSVDILTREKNYKYAYKACKWFLASEGLMLNHKKTGEWKKYFDEGKIKKIVEY